MKHDLVLRRGQVPEGLFFVIYGSVLVYKKDPHSSLKVYGEGSDFGDGCLLMARSHYYYQCTRNTVCLFIGHLQLRHILHEKFLDARFLDQRAKMRLRHLDNLDRRAQEREKAVVRMNADGVKSDHSKIKGQQNEPVIIKRKGDGRTENADEEGEPGIAKLADQIIGVFEGKRDVSRNKLPPINNLKEVSVNKKLRSTSKNDSMKEDTGMIDGLHNAFEEVMARRLSLKGDIPEISEENRLVEEDLFQQIFKNLEDPSIRRKKRRMMSHKHSKIIQRVPQHKISNNIIKTVQEKIDCTWSDYFKGFCLEQESIEKLEQQRFNKSYVKNGQWSVAIKKTLGEKILPRKFRPTKDLDGSFLEEELVDDRDAIEALDPISDILKGIFSENQLGGDLQQEEIEELEMSGIQDDPLVALKFKEYNKIVVDSHSPKNLVHLLSVRI